MKEVEPKTKLEEKPVETRVDLDQLAGDDIFFDIDDMIHRREVDPFPLDDYEDLGAFIDRAND